MIAKRRNPIDTLGREPNIGFVRHGRSIANDGHFLAGSMDVGLTPEGVQQAKQAGEAIKASSKEFDVIVTSDLQRALGTGAIIADAIGVHRDKIIPLEVLRERDGGSYQGGDLDAFYKATDAEIAVAGGEDFNTLGLRAIEGFFAVKDIAAEHGRTLVVGHAEIKRALDAIALGLSPNFMLNLPKAPNAQLQPYPETLLNPEFHLWRGVVLTTPNNGWTTFGLRDPKSGEITEITEAPVEPGTALKRGDQVDVGVSMYGDSEDNLFVKIPQPAKKKWFAGRR